MFNFFSNTKESNETDHSEQRYQIDGDSDDDNAPLGNSVSGATYSTSFTRKNSGFFKRRTSTSLSRQPAVAPTVPKRQTSRPPSMRESVVLSDSLSPPQLAFEPLTKDADVRKSYLSNIFKSFKSADEIYVAQEQPSKDPRTLIQRNDSVTSSGILSNYMTNYEPKKRVAIHEKPTFINQPSESSEAASYQGFFNLFRSSSGRKAPVDSGKRPSATSDSISGEVDRLYRLAVSSAAVPATEFSDKDGFLGGLNGSSAASAAGLPEGRAAAYGRPTVAGYVLFLLGFVFVPSWWVGSVIPLNPIAPVELNFKSLNQGMSVLSTCYLALMAGLLIWESSRYGSITV